MLPCAIIQSTCSHLPLPSLHDALSPSFRGILLPTNIATDPFPRIERLLMIRGTSAGMLRIGR